MAKVKRTSKPRETGLQDGMMQWLRSQTLLADANIEARIDREPFDFRDMMKGTSCTKDRGQ